ncbi:unnamed protein product [Coregonus sp. 'balchen']|nr:unnamed protein product [Coregonus sp. 'balchen']
MPTSKAIWMNGHLSGIGDVAPGEVPHDDFQLVYASREEVEMIWFDSSPLNSLLTLEVLIRVQVFDNSDLSPLAEAAVEVYGNQSTLASSKAGKDGVVMVTFLYHPGTWVIITATKQGFVTNSAPWHASRIPWCYPYVGTPQITPTICSISVSTRPLHLTQLLL